MSDCIEKLEKEIRELQRKIDHLYAEVQQNPKDLIRIYSQISSCQQDIQAKKNWIKTGGKGLVSYTLPSNVKL